jgi:hypothetical protein
MNFSFMLVALCKFLVPLFSFRVLLILDYMMNYILPLFCACITKHHFLTLKTEYLLGPSEYLRLL